MIKIDKGEVRIEGEPSLVDAELRTLMFSLVTRLGFTKEDMYDLVNDTFEFKDKIQPAIDRLKRLVELVGGETVEKCKACPDLDTCEDGQKRVKGEDNKGPSKCENETFEDIFKDILGD